MRSLLVIDDDEDLGDALFTFLKEEGYRVRLASSGRQGILLAQAEAPHAILLDWQMPQMGGQQVLAELATLPVLRDVPVILMSANVADISADALKARSYLSKPFDVDRLISLVARELSDLSP